MGDAEAIAAHLDWLRLRGLSAGTLWARQRALARMTVLLPCPLLEASPEDLLAWRRGLQLSPHAVRSYVSHAHQFYAWALAEGLVAANPAAGLPVPRRGRTVPRPVGEPELMLALAAAPPRVRPWLVLAGWAGLRAREIAFLRRENVLEQAPSPVIRVVAGATKGADERVVPMSRFVVAELGPVLPARGWVFVRLNGRGPNQPWTVSHLANAHLHGCGITATLHQLRHRFGTEAYRVGKDLRAVQELLGHRDPASTAGYAAPAAPAAVEAVEGIPVPPPRLRACG